MEATAQAPIATHEPPRKEYSSRPGALIWSFRKSRNEWKAKCKAAKDSLKREKNRVADLSKSRERWRAEAERAGRRGAELEAEVAELRSRLEAGLEKKRTGRRAC